MVVKERGIFLRRSLGREIEGQILDGGREVAFGSCDNCGIWGFEEGSLEGEFHGFWEVEWGLEM